MLNTLKTGWFESAARNLKAGHSLNQAEILFTKIEDKTIEEQKNKMSPPEESAIDTSLIDYENFMKTELRVAQIISAENVKKSKKLMKLTVNVGNENRQIVAGIAEHYTAGELIGKKIALVANLKPAKIFGLESNGMLLAAKDDVSLKILEVDQAIKPGSKIN